MKILIVKLNGFEKVMLSIPLVRALKMKFPEASIHYLSNPENEYYLETVDTIDKIFLSQGDIIPLDLQLI